MLFALGCSHPFNAKLNAKPDLRASVIAVYPFGFRWDEPSYRPFELSQRIITAALARAGDQLLFIGPTEFKIYKAESDQPWVSTNLISLFPSMQLKPDVALVLRPWAEKREQAGEKELLNAKGQKVGHTSTQETTYVGHLELIHPSSNTVVLEMTGEAPADPFANAGSDDSDPAPELTALMEKMTDAAMKIVLRWAKTPFAAPRDLGVTYAFNPKVEFTVATEGRPPFEMELLKMDAVEAEVLTQSRVKFINPALSEDQIGKLSKLPGGIWVLTAGPGAKLEVGDLITQVEGQPAVPQALERARFFDIPAQVKIRKPNGGIADAIVP